MTKTGFRYHTICMFQVVLIIWNLLGVSACLSKSKPPDLTPELSGKETILVLPFRNLTKETDAGGIVRCPGCGTAFLSGEVLKTAGRLLTTHLLSFLRNNTSLILVTAHQPTITPSEPLSQSPNAVTEREALMTAGRTAKTDMVLAGYIFRFKQRIGTQYSVQSPASVAFGLHLINTDLGVSLWEGHYDETQQSLSENLFGLPKFIKRKWKWITAEEMAISGLQKMLETFPTP
ncbi:MAG: hypothetical protein PVI06_14290 [Desulfobacterales bacterium]